MGVVPLTLLVAIFIIGVDNLALWNKLSVVSKVGHPGGWGFAVVVGIALVAILALLLSLFAFRWLYKPFLIIVLLITALVSYYMNTYGVLINDTMILNMFNTDVGEIEGLLNARLWLHLFLVWFLPSALILWIRIKRATWWRQGLIRIGFVVVVAGIAFGAIASHYKELALTVRSHSVLKMYPNPTYAIYSAFEVVDKHLFAEPPPRLTTIGRDAHRLPAADHHDRRKILVIVVGETTRAKNWGLDGYARHTTPQLAALPLVINFPDAHSCGTSTVISVPCMFSARGRDDFDPQRARHTENLLDVLQRTGITVRWEENQAGGCKDVCDRVPTKNMRTMDIPGVCEPGHCMDGVFLHGFIQRVKATSGDLVLVMHTMGSHGPKYFRRYPPGFAKYTPECVSNRPQQCDQQELINSYDNTIRYIDHVLASLVGKLRTRLPNADTALFYLSDHGESLGEDGIYLHGFPYLFAPDEQTHIPMILWLSGNWQKDAGLANACLKQITQQRVGQDNLFSTVMGLMEVRASVYQPDMDLLSPCRISRQVAHNS